MLADTLDGLASALFLVDGNGRIIHANASAHNMLSEGNVLRAPNGVLRTFDLRTDQALLDIFTAASGGDAPIGVKGIAVPLEARNGEAHIAHVLPLTAGARRRAGTTYRAVAAIFVRKAALDARSPFEVIAQRFGLTDTELRVLFSIIEVGAPAEVAEVLGVREGTIRTHLHRLFEKNSNQPASRSRQAGRKLYQSIGRLIFFRHLSFDRRAARAALLHSVRITEADGGRWNNQDIHLRGHCARVCHGCGIAVIVTIA